MRPDPGNRWPLERIYASSRRREVDAKEDFVSQFSSASKAEDPAPSSLVALARQAVETYVRQRRTISPPTELNAQYAQAAGVFVCIKLRGCLRGCMGTASPLMSCITEETIANAISAATADPRFAPISDDDLPHLSYCVDVLTEPEPVTSCEQLDARRYGVIVQRGTRRGLLLPDLEEVDTPEEQIEISRQKAGIGPHEPVDLFRFEVIRYE
jgi:MEMO1 family protein